MNNGDICVTKTGAIGIYAQDGILTTEGVLPAEDFDPDFVLRYAPNGLDIESAKTGVIFPVVSVGDRGLTVVLVQQALKCKKYYSGNIDGDFGPVTHKALYDFMKDHYLDGETETNEKVLQYLFKEE